mgnify:CR=1 FL=1
MRRLLRHQSRHRTLTFRAGRAFTLIELLVVIAIIGVLSSVVLVSVNASRRKSKDARRVADLKTINTAIQLYYDDFGRYQKAPIFGFPTWSECAQWGSHAPEDVIPGLVPDYLKVFPTDPDMDAASTRAATSTAPTSA